jgi:hypothetical protein
MEKYKIDSEGEAFQFFTRKRHKGIGAREWLLSLFK